jgi:hypothetical protein
MADVLAENIAFEMPFAAAPNASVFEPYTVK